MVPLSAFVSREMLVFAGRLLFELTAIFLVVTFLVELLRHGLDPGRMRRFLQGRTPVGGMLAAALLGAVTPFCSCSTVPLTAAMMRAGVPLPAMSTFLIMSPLLNPATLAILVGLAGIRYGALYVLAAFAVALGVGTIMFLFKRAEATGPAMDEPAALLPWSARVRGSVLESVRSLRKLLPAFLVAVAVGAVLHDQVAGAWLRPALATTAWWTIPVAAVVGVPVYASTALLIPLGTALYQGGVGLDVITAFLMGATGFSIPEGILLHRIVGTRLLLVLATVFTSAVVLVGYGIHFLI